MTQIIIAFRNSAKRRKTNQAILCEEIFTVCSGNLTKHINSLCVQNVEYFNGKYSGIQTNH